MVAAVLYGNIGIKVFYENVLRAYFKAPSMLTKRGRVIFGVSVIMYWFIAWIIGVAVPSLNALVTLVGSAFILQFTYTFPPVLCLGYWMQIDAMKGDNPWEPGMVPGSNRVDTWKQMSRWKRGLARYWYAKIFLVSCLSIFLSAVLTKLTCLLRVCCSLLPSPTAHSVFTPVLRKRSLASKADSTGPSLAKHRTLQIHSWRNR